MRLNPQHLHLMALVARSSLFAAGMNSLHCGFGLGFLQGSAEFGIVLTFCGSQFCISTLVPMVQLS